MTEEFSKIKILQIRLRSFNSISVDQSALLIMKKIYESGLKFSGPIPIPKKIEKFTPSKSVHINKDIKHKNYIDFFGNKARHDRLLFLFDVDSTAIELFRNANLLSGVGIEIKVHY